MTTPKKSKVSTDDTITTFKGFTKDLTCTGGDKPFQYALGESYEHDGAVVACGSGFHACEYPLDVFRYYAPATSRFALVEQSGDLARHSEDSKVASRKITIKAEIGIAGLIKAAIEYTTSRALPVDKDSPTFSSGDQGAAQASGDQGAAQASGDQGAAQASGYQGAAQASGYQGAAQASGTRGAAQASGYQGAAQASGTRGAAQASGDQGAAQASGYQGAAQASGYQGAAQASGYQGAAQALGKYSTATAAGVEGRARGIEGSALFLVYRDSSGDWDDQTYARIVHARAVIVGQDGIRPNVWYGLNAAGEVVEVSE